MSINNFCTRLERLADEATPGPWKVLAVEVDLDAVYLFVTEEDRNYSHDGVCDIGYSETANNDDDAAHIAANSPDTTKALLRVVRAAEDTRDSLRDMIELAAEDYDGDVTKHPFWPYVVAADLALEALPQETER